MKNTFQLTLILLSVTILQNCAPNTKKPAATGKTAAELLGNKNYPAISFGGYREISRDIQPTVAELKEDIRLLHALGFRMLRTYNVYLDEAGNLLKAIREIRQESPDFEMYVMLGAWIDCKNAWTTLPERIRNEDSPRNATEIARAAELAAEYPEIVKVLAVGNETMVKWATEYYVEPEIILRWVNHLQGLKKEGKLPATLWITSSDNFASWGGGGAEYHTAALGEIIRAVDYLSIHTYPMHDTHYNPDFWGVRDNETSLSAKEQIDSAMVRSRDYAIGQYRSVVRYMKSLGVDKPVHIGETGWSTQSNEFYGPEGSRATDEYKSGTYYRLIREWAERESVSVFYFEAFDEKWKDARNPGGSENHFGLIDLDAKAKYAIWDQVDAGVLNGLTRNGKPITKSFDGRFDLLWETVQVPPTDAEIQERRNSAKKAS